jgi:hypothetical protein
MNEAKNAFGRPVSEVDRVGDLGAGTGGSRDRPPRRRHFFVLVKDCPVFVTKASRGSG